MASALLYSAQPALAYFKQQGPKLVGTGATGSAEQGMSVALSADGRTAIVGAPTDNSNAGAAWVFTRSGRVWTQQAKLVGSAVGSAQQGRCVALSADGNTAIVGGSQDNSNAGAAWVFTRSGSVWTQQAKLVGTGAVGAAYQGTSVALSADGSTAIVGGWADNSQAGAAWVFIRSGGVWSQQGAKLVGSGAVGSAEQGVSVALSADGSTAIVGGSQDNSNAGGAWVFTRSGGVWAQQGAKLVGTGAVGTALRGNRVAVSGDGDTAIVGGPWDNSFAGAAWVFTRSGGVWSQQAKLVGANAVGAAQVGFSVTLSRDGNTAMLGAPIDNSNAGAAWVFTRSGGVWTQQGQKVVGTSAAGPARQGISVALCADGHTAIVGGPYDNNSTGAAWVFVNTATHDFNGDGFSDIAWRHSGGAVGALLMNGTQVLQFGVAWAPTDWSVVGQRDFNGDGKADILWRNSNSGDVAIWLMNGLQIVQAGVVLSQVPLTWSVVGTGDFDGDGKADILWRNSNSGDVSIWLMNGLQMGQAGVVLSQVPLTSSIVGTGDFDGDGKADILWRDTNSGDIAIWLMNGLQIVQTGTVSQVPLAWSVVGTGDFNGDGRADILWRDSSGNVAIWTMGGLQLLSGVQSGVLGNVATDWTIAETGDFDGDGHADILWRNSKSGDVAIWFMTALQISSSADLGIVPTDWTIQGLNAD